MKRALGLWAILPAVMVALAAVPSAKAAEHKPEAKAEAPKEKKPKAPKKSVCDNRLLPYQQRYLCEQQMAKVQTKPEMKKVEERYSNMVKDIERQQKEEKEKH